MGSEVFIGTLFSARRYRHLFHSSHKNDFFVESDFVVISGITDAAEKAALKASAIK